MDLIDILKPKRSEFTTGIPEFDANINIADNRIISICTDESMLSTQLLHFLAKKGAEQYRRVWYFDVGGNFQPELYGIPSDLAARISPLFASSTHDLAQTIGQLTDRPLILLDTLNMIYHEKNQDKYVESAIRILEGLRSNDATIVLTEFTNGVTGRAPTAPFEEIYDRVFLNSRDEMHPHYRFSFEITKCGRGIAEPITLSKFDFQIPRDSDYHKYFVQTYG